MVHKDKFRRRFSFMMKLRWIFLLSPLAIFLTSEPGFGQTFQKIEASFTLTNSITDPFDYTTADVRVQILQPDTTVINLPAFFDGGTTWRVRHAPTLAGTFQVSGVTLNGLSVQPGNLQPASWLVAGRPVSAGYIRVDPANSNKFVTSDGRRFFPAGQDLAWDTSSAVTVSNTLPRLGAAHENWARIWMDDWDGKNLEWPKSGAFGHLNLSVAQKWDGIITAAEQARVYVQMTLQYHGEYSTQVDPEWAQNPFNTANGGFLSDPTQFFTNATAMALTMKKYRYITARWGYSPSVMAWEMFNEVQFTDAGRAGMWSMIGAWHDTMAQFIRGQDAYHHLITTSSDVSQPIFNQCDYFQHHDYPSDYISALRDPPQLPAGRIRPIFGGEAGSDLTPYYGISAPLWAGMMSGQSAGCQPWYWDRIEAENAYPLLKSYRDWVSMAGLAEQDNLGKSAPHVTCAQNTALVFAPGGSYASAVQDTFTVGEVAPDGIGTLPSFLQGTYHRNMTPNGYTFNVNYPAGGGTFSAQVLTIAQSGGSLRITVDNTTTNEIDFPAAPTDQNTNYTLSIAVPAGAHVIKLWNPGLDWVVLGNLTFNPYVPMLGAYQLGNTNFAAAWIWHRTNVYGLNPGTGVAGTFPLSGLQSGTYSGQWYDCVAGVTLTNFSFSVSNNGPVTIPIPTVIRSLAFFAGVPAQAVVPPVSIVTTLGTNSPPLSSQIVISNRGGLPLAYSLSITGLSLSAYTATDSRQNGGPDFAWKDIGAIGRDLTTNFTSLIGKTAHDEGIAGPIALGFNFPFFSGTNVTGLYSQIYISPNGFVTFSPFAGDTSTNLALPSLNAPTNMIACFWDDLDLGTTGRVYCANDPLNGEFTIQWHNVRFKSSATNALFQLTLKTTGEILMRYVSIPISNACTVGVQNQAGTQGLQVAFNQNYLQNNLCVRLTPCAWLDVQKAAALVPRISGDPVNVVLNPMGMAFGKYTATILALTSDPLLPFVNIPVVMNVSPLATWRQSHFGSPANSGAGADSADPDGDGLKNIFEYAFNTDPAVSNSAPFASSITTNHLTISFKRLHPAPADITYLVEESDSLSPPAWQSGPALFNQSIQDNLDGTETVTLADTQPVTANGARYLRFSISVP